MCGYAEMIAAWFGQAANLRFMAWDRAGERRKAQCSFLNVKANPIRTGS